MAESFLNHPSYIRAVDRARKAGCRCTRPEAILRWALTHVEAWPEVKPVRLFASPGTPPERLAPVAGVQREVPRQFTREEREVRRARADPAFRRRLLRRMQRQAKEIAAKPVGRLVAYSDLAHQFCRVSRTSKLTPLRCVTLGLGGDRTDRYAMARVHKAPLAGRQGKDWDVVAGECSKVHVRAASTSFRNGGQCRYPGGAIRAGYRVVYTRTERITVVLSLAWLDPEGRAWWQLHETLYRVPGEWTIGTLRLIDVEGVAVTGLDLIRRGLAVRSEEKHGES